MRLRYHELMEAFEEAIMKEEQGSMTEQSIDTKKETTFAYVSEYKAPIIKHKIILLTKIYKTILCIGY